MLGAKASTKEIADLLYQYDLAPDEVTTILESTYLSSKKIKAVLRLLNNLDKQNADPSITAKDRATAKFHEARRLLNYLDGRHATMTITTVRNTVFNKARKALNYGYADGGVVDFYAAGGMREKHAAQIAPAGAWRVWAEPETGGEAYIPLSPMQRERSVEIWREDRKSVV